MNKVDLYVKAATRDNTRRSYRSAIEHFEVSSSKSQSTCFGMATRFSVLWLTGSDDYHHCMASYFWWHHKRYGPWRGDDLYLRYELRVCLWNWFCTKLTVVVRDIFCSCINRINDTGISTLADIKRLNGE